MSKSTPSEITATEPLEQAEDAATEALEWSRPTVSTFDVSKSTKSGTFGTMGPESPDYSS